MTPNEMNPDAVVAAVGAQGALLGGLHPDHTTAPKANKPTLTVRLEPDAPPVTVWGREAQTLALLIERGASGFTSGEASPLGWARRTSHYIFKLRGQGIAIATAMEPTPDGAVVARYFLAEPVTVVSKGVRHD